MHRSRVGVQPRRGSRQRSGAETMVDTHAITHHCLWLVPVEGGHQHLLTLYMWRIACIECTGPAKTWVQGPPTHAPRYVLSSQEEAVGVEDSGMRRSGRPLSRPPSVPSAERSGPSTGCSADCGTRDGGGWLMGWGWAVGAGATGSMGNQWCSTPVDPRVAQAPSTRGLGQVLRPTSAAADQSASAAPRRLLG